MIHSGTYRRTILFVHGWWGGDWVWSSFASHFSKLGYDCHTIDLYRNRAEINQSFYVHLEELSRATAELDSQILIGHSAGGLLIQKLLEQVDVPAAVLIGSAPPRGILAATTWALAKAFLKYAPTILIRKPFLLSKSDMYALNLNYLNADEKEAVYSRMVPISAKEAIEIVVEGVTVDAMRVLTPMLVLNGSQDRLTPTSVARQIAKKYQAAYREYPKNAHYMMCEENSQEVANEIDFWLRHRKGIDVPGDMENDHFSSPSLRHKRALR